MVKMFHSSSCNQCWSQYICIHHTFVNIWRWTILSSNRDARLFIASPFYSLKIYRSLSLSTWESLFKYAFRCVYEIDFELTCGDQNIHVSILLFSSFITSGCYGCMVFNSRLKCHFKSLLHVRFHCWLHYLSSTDGMLSLSCFHSGLFNAPTSK